jgi:hypothetical protein
VGTGAWRGKKLMTRELIDIGLRPDLASCFVEIQQVVEPHAAQSKEMLFEAFQRMFRTPEARINNDVVFVWAVDQPYVHNAGRCRASQIVYIEKTKRSMSRRWSNENLRRITTDFDNSPSDAALDSLIAHANANRNLTFYRELIQRHGALRIWWATSERLNQTSATPHYNAEAWEGHLLALYLDAHECRPLKNRRGGRLLLDV